MQSLARRNNTTQDENIHVARGKVGLPTKRQGLGLRGALGDVNGGNVPVQRDVGIGKVAVATAEFEKKAALNKLKSTYGHVQSKIDTGLSQKAVQPSARAPLRREESTAGLAARAIRSRVALKDTQNKAVKPKENVAKKEPKKTKVTVKEDIKDKENRRVPTKIRDPVESFEKLKLVDTKQIKKHEYDAITNSPEVKMPQEVEDIDASDKNCPLLISEYIKDIYRYLHKLEVDFPIEQDHLRKQSVITGKMRATLVDWLVEVQRQFSLLLETFHLTIGIIDRYLQVAPNVQRDQLQLIGVTAMYIASKYEEIHAPEVGDFIYVTANAYKKTDVFQCERDILSKLDFRLTRPIPLSFLRRFVKAAHGISKHHHMAKYFVDLCLMEYSMSHYLPSELAAAAICLSIHLLSGKTLQDIWTPTLQYFAEYSLKHIHPIICKIAMIVINIENCKFKAVYNKYMDTSLAKVASLPVLKGDAIHELAKLSE